MHAYVYTDIEQVEITYDAYIHTDMAHTHTPTVQNSENKSCD